MLSYNDRCVVIFIDPKYLRAIVVGMRAMHTFQADLLAARQRGEVTTPFFISHIHI